MHRGLFTLIVIHFVFARIVASEDNKPDKVRRDAVNVKLVKKIGNSASTRISGIGFTGSRCSKESECKAGRFCSDSVCFPVNIDDAKCNCQKDCISGEVCTIQGVCFSEDIATLGLLDLTICETDSTTSTQLSDPTSSPTPLPPEKEGPLSVSTSPEPTSTNRTSTVAEAPAATVSPAPCVDARLLSHFEPQELLYEQHLLAGVLCDSAGSCATKGHIVHYKEKAMMMSSYCRIVTCEDRIMKVNSPIPKRGLKVNTKSQELRFTAFSARYETKIEEYLLSTAVHMGM